LPHVQDFPVRLAMLENESLVTEWVERVEESRRQVEMLGEVNLAALQEFVELRARHVYLEEQRSDLEESVAAIRKAIAQINRTCRERFRDAYDKVNANFQVLYPRLVGGGSARLQLTNEDDLLETGVEILAQPPGKRLQNLTLLSGGEKAMTALALIFSLFQVKPSPFCLLDEVDAPLDDSNGSRFNQMLREMSATSQFIVITHNKKTMEVMDTLYGVTMPKPGQSRLVSVQIH
jgi:chromosome segregation protein